MLKKFLGINWKTTVPGVLAIVAAAGRIALAYRTRDIESILTNGQDMTVNVGLVLSGVGLITAKAADVTGVGTKAAQVDASGRLITAEGDVVGKQPPA